MQAEPDDHREHRLRLHLHPRADGHGQVGGDWVEHKTEKKNNVIKASINENIRALKEMCIAYKGS